MNWDVESTWYTTFLTTLAYLWVEPQTMQELKSGCSRKTFATNGATSGWHERPSVTDACKGWYKESPILAKSAIKLTSRRDQFMSSGIRSAMLKKTGPALLAFFKTLWITACLPSMGFSDKGINRNFPATDASLAKPGSVKEPPRMKSLNCWPSSVPTPRSSLDQGWAHWRSVWDIPTHMRRHSAASDRATFSSKWPKQHSRCGKCVQQEVCIVRLNCRCCLPASKSSRIQARSASLQKTVCLKATSAADSMANSSKKGRNSWHASSGARKFFSGQLILPNKRILSRPWGSLWHGQDSNQASMWPIQLAKLQIMWTQLQNVFESTASPALKMFGPSNRLSPKAPSAAPARSSFLILPCSLLKLQAGWIPKAAQRNFDFSQIFANSS